MKNASLAKGRGPFQFVLEELTPIRPIIKLMFGCVYVYLAEKFILLLRDRLNQPAYNGIWLASTAEHLESLRREFPLLPKRCIWNNGEKGWVFLPSRLEEFEQYAMTACELILRGDQRIGRVTEGKPNKGRTVKTLGEKRKVKKSKRGKQVER